MQRLAGEMRHPCYLPGRPDTGSVTTGTNNFYSRILPHRHRRGKYDVFLLILQKNNVTEMAGKVTEPRVTTDYRQEPVCIL